MLLGQETSTICGGLGAVFEALFEPSDPASFGAQTVTVGRIEDWLVGTPDRKI